MIILNKLRLADKLIILQIPQAKFEWFVFVKTIVDVFILLTNVWFNLSYYFRYLC